LYNSYKKVIAQKKKLHSYKRSCDAKIPVLRQAPHRYSQCTVSAFIGTINNSNTLYIEKQDSLKIKFILADSLQIEMNRIKEVLEEKGVKQTWLAEQLGKSYNMVNGYVQNRQQPRLEVLFEIAKILGVKPKDLLKDKK
jgi:putative transcriptional regulator